MRHIQTSWNYFPEFVWFVDQPRAVEIAKVDKTGHTLYRLHRQSSIACYIFGSVVTYEFHIQSICHCLICWLVNKSNLSGILLIEQKSFPLLFSLCSIDLNLLNLWVQFTFSTSSHFSLERISALHLNRWTRWMNFCFLACLILLVRLFVHSCAFVAVCYFLLFCNNCVKNCQNKENFCMEKVKFYVVDFGPTSNISMAYLFFRVANVGKPYYVYAHVRCTCNAARWERLTPFNQISAFQRAK